MKKREFLKRAGVGTAAAVAAAGAPYVHAQKKTAIKWRLRCNRPSMHSPPPHPVPRITPNTMPKPFPAP